MQKYFRITYIVTLFLLCAIALTGCRRVSLPSFSVPGIKPAGSQGTSNKRLPNTDQALQNRGRFVRTDAEGIVSVAIENGKAELRFDRDKWNETRGLYYGEDIFFIPDTMPDTFYPIQVEGGNVVDACIAKLPSLEPDLPADAFMVSAVVLLMDDGSIEWFYANPNGLFVPDGAHEPNYSISTFGKLPYRDDFKSLSFEPTGEGIGESTIYITNAFGDRYDFLYLYLEEQLQYGTWVCALANGSVHGYLTIDVNGDALFRVGNGKSTGMFLEETFEIWEGTANFVKSPGQHLPLGMLDFDMELAVNQYDDGRKLPAKMQGSYRTDITLTQDGMLRLYHNDGDALYPSGANGTLTFELLPDAFYFDDEGSARDDYAYIRFDKIGGDGHPQLFADFVTWVHDENEANDYRIENEAVKWTSLKTTSHTACTIWNYDTMESEELSVFDFAKRLKAGTLYGSDGGQVLVIVTVAEDTIESIYQLYTP